MRILMINSVCGIRSTGRICADLATAFDAQGHEVKIAYGRETVPEHFQKYAVRIGSELDVKLHGVKARLLDADGLGSRKATRDFMRWVENYNPDIIHLHNLHGYYINVPILFDYIIRNHKKVLWTLHDCWTFTGHSGTCDQVNCEKWKTGCCSCPAIKGYPKSYIDRSSFNYAWKKQLFQSVDDLTLVTPSKWLAGLVKQSFLKDKAITVIPNGIDTTQFCPLNNDFKEYHGIQNKIMLLGCASSWGRSKGLDDFKYLAEKLDDRYAIVLVGLKKEQMKGIPSKIICIEQTDSVKELVQIYSAADLFVNLSYVDVFSMVNREALLCGTPILTYNTGGCTECLNCANGVSFEKGDINGVLRFLENEYHAEMFADASINADEHQSMHTDPISKEAMMNKYTDVMRGGYFEQRLKYGALGKITVLGVAAFWGERKGMDVFIRLAADLPKEYEIFMIGVNKEQLVNLPSRIHAIERTSNIEELSILYSIADVFVNPTRQDNYPTVNLEAVACGTPVVTYRTGGSPENSFTPNCVVDQNDYEALLEVLLSGRFENGLRIEDRQRVSKEYMMTKYSALYTYSFKH